MQENISTSYFIVCRIGLYKIITSFELHVQFLGYSVFAFLFILSFACPSLLEVCCLFGDYRCSQENVEFSCWRVDYSHLYRTCISRCSLENSFSESGFYFFLESCWESRDHWRTTRNQYIVIERFPQTHFAILDITIHTAMLLKTIYPHPSN